jgi:hypothetical protein
MFNDVKKFSSSVTAKIAVGVVGSSRDGNATTSSAAFESRMARQATTTETGNIVSTKMPAPNAAQV